MCKALNDLIADGETRGEAKIITLMLNNGKTIDEIAEFTGLDASEIRAVIDNCK